MLTVDTLTICRRHGWWWVGTGDESFSSYSYWEYTSS